MRVSTIFAALALIPLPLKATDISGQVFIVTRGAETIKLALVPIAAYKKEDVLATVKAVDVEFTKARERSEIPGSKQNQCVGIGPHATRI